jgi:hypothetical protein
MEELTERELTLILTVIRLMNSDKTLNEVLQQYDAVDKMLKRSDFDNPSKAGGD